LALYGAKEDNLSLEDYRFKCFLASATKSSIYLASLPPTLEALQQHTSQTYHQIQLWQGNTLPPFEWGWMIEDDNLVPITTIAAPAPQAC